MNDFYIQLPKFSLEDETTEQWLSLFAYGFDQVFCMGVIVVALEQ